MAEQDFWKVQIGSTWLTDDGTETGMPCQVDVGGLGPLFLDYASSIRKAADGTPYAFILPSDWQGDDVVVTVLAMRIEEFQDIQTDINAALAAESLIAVSITWNAVVFEFDALSVAVTPPGSFTAERLNNVGFNFTVHNKTP